MANSPDTQDNWQSNTNPLRHLPEPGTLEAEIHSQNAQDVATAYNNIWNASPEDRTPAKQKLLLNEFERLRQSIDNEALRQGVIDNLTGLTSRAKFIEDLDLLTTVINRQIGNSLKHILTDEAKAEFLSKPALSIFILDINNLKRINGESDRDHSRGDKVIKAVGTCLKDTYRRQGDFLGRFGGDEDVIACLSSDGSVTQAKEVQLAQFQRFYQSLEITRGSEEFIFLQENDGTVSCAGLILTNQDIAQIFDILKHCQLNPNEYAEAIFDLLYKSYLDPLLGVTKGNDKEKRTNRIRFGYVKSWNDRKPDFEVTDLVYDSKQNTLVPFQAETIMG